MLGAGSWGAVLAAVFAQHGHDVALWCRSVEQAASMAATRRSPRAAPELTLPPTVLATASLSQALESAEVVIFALPSDAMRAVAETVAPILASNATLLSCAKGFERDSGLRMTELLARVIPSTDGRVAALSGPNLAAEIAAGHPAASVIACADRRLGLQLQQSLSSPQLRLYTNVDVLGVEYAGALKNCIAIAAGVADGLKMGVNTRSALVTRGLAEMTRLGTAAGAQPLTFAGLAGLGDLIATCSSSLSRNYQVGLRLAGGETWPHIVAALGHVAEGVNTTMVARGLASRYGVRTPIIDRAYEVLFENRSVSAALGDLITGAPRDELLEIQQVTE